MGCCQSTAARDEGSSSPYSASNVNGDISTQAITGPSRNVPEVSGPNPSANAAQSSRPSRSRRTIGLQEQFNAPLHPHMWTSKRQWTRKQLDRERDEFFDTRVTGREEIWATLKVVVGLMIEGDVATAQGILDASAITLPTGDLINGAYDQAGNFYQMPEHVINDPSNIISDKGNDIAKEEDATDDEELERKREEKGKGVLKVGETVKVKARLSDRGGPDIVVSVGKEQNVRVLIRRIQEEAHITGKGKLKIGYLGRIFKESETLLAQGWREGHVINALVFQ